MVYTNYPLDNFQFLELYSSEGKIIGTVIHDANNPEKSVVMENFKQDKYQLNQDYIYTGYTFLSNDKVIEVNTLIIDNKLSNQIVEMYNKTFTLKQIFNLLQIR